MRTQILKGIWKHNRQQSLRAGALAFSVMAVGCGQPEIPVPSAVRADRGPEALQVMSYNVQCALCNFERSWATRLGEFRELIAHHSPDIIAAQELILPLDAEHFRSALPPDRAGGGWASICTVNCDSTTYYRRSRLRLHESGSIWLSSWPYRYAAWAVFEDLKNGAHFLFVNAHFDNHQPNQLKSALLLKQSLEPWLERGLPVMVAGDFNSSPGGRAFVHEGHIASAEGYAALNSYLTNTHDDTARCLIHTNHPDPASNPLRFEQGIDHIFVSPGGWQVAEWGIDYRWTLNSISPRPQYPSDHWPIVARVAFQGPGNAAALNRDRRCSPQIAPRG